MVAELVRDAVVSSTSKNDPVTLEIEVYATCYLAAGTMQL